MSSQSLSSSQCTIPTMTVTKPPLLAAKKQPTPIYPLTSTVNGLSNTIPSNSAMMSVAYPAQSINPGMMTASQIGSVNTVGGYNTAMNTSTVQLMPMGAGQFQPMFMVPPVIGAQGMFLQPAFMTPQVLSTPQSMVSTCPTATVSSTPPRQAVLPIQQQQVMPQTTISTTRNLNQPMNSIRPIASSTPLQTVSVRPNFSTGLTTPNNNMVNISAVRPTLAPVRPALPLGQTIVTKASAVVTGSPRSLTSSTITPKPIAAKPTFVNSPANNKLLKTPPLAPRGIVTPLSCQQPSNQACRPIQPAVTSSAVIQPISNPNNLPKLAPAAGIRRPECHVLNHVTMKKKKRALAAVNKALLQSSIRPTLNPSQIRPLTVSIPPISSQIPKPPIIYDRSLLPETTAVKPPPRAQLVSPMPAAKPPSVSQVLVSNPNRPPGSLPRFPLSRFPQPIKSFVAPIESNLIIDDAAEVSVDPPEPEETPTPFKEVSPIVKPPSTSVSPSAPFSPHLTEATPKVLPQDQKSSNPSPSEQTPSSFPTAQANNPPQSSPENKGGQKEAPKKRLATDSKERERWLPSKRTAVVRPEQRRILTHLIDDYVIYESNKPFPVKRGLELVEATILRQSDTALTKDFSLSSEREDDTEEEGDSETKCQKDEEICKTPVETIDNVSLSSEGCVESNQTDIPKKVLTESPAPKSSVSPIRTVAPTRICMEETQPTVSVSPTKAPPSSSVTPSSYVAPRPSPIPPLIVDPLISKPPRASSSTPSSHSEISLPEPVPPSRPPEFRVSTPSDYLKRDISSWSVADVHHFVLNTPGCHNYAALFKSSEIDGEALLLLSEEHLIQVPISMKVGPALKLSARIEELKLSAH